MTRIASSVIAIILASLVVVGSIAFAGPEKYTLKLGKLAFSDFRGYENWQVVAVSQTETLLKVIVANEVMMRAFRQGLPAAGKLFHEGSKVAKIEWTPKKNAVAPYFVMVPDTLKAVATIEKLRSDSRTRTDGRMVISTTMPRLTRFPRTEAMRMRVRLQPSVAHVISSRASCLAVNKSLLSNVGKQAFRLERRVLVECATRHVEDCPASLATYLYLARSGRPADRRADSQSPQRGTERRRAFASNCERPGDSVPLDSRLDRLHVKIRCF